MPAHSAPPTNPPINTATSASGPLLRVATNVARAAPIATWPSCPMLTRPARVETIAPSATNNRGTASASVPPHRPGLRKLPSRIALSTFCHGPPVTAMSTADATSANEIDTAYSPRSTTPRRARAASAGRIFIVRMLRPRRRHRAAGRGAPTWPSSRSSSPMIRPRDITTMRSDRSRISSNSVEISSTAMPEAAAARSRAVVYSIAPTSRPRVGWEATSTFGRWLSSRASTTRCWLPPDRLRIGASGAAPWISNSAISSSARRRRRALLTNPKRATEPGRSMSRFSAIVMSSTHPESWRSSGITATPWRAMQPARRVSTVAPSIVTVPPSRWIRLDIRSPSGR